MSLRGKLVASLAVAAVLGLSLIGALPDLFASQDAQASGQFFSETGHFVKAPFYAFYVAHNGPSFFGYPLTEQLQDPNTKLVVQYFQRVRMEATPSGEVTVSKLASEMGFAQPRLSTDQIPPDSPYQRYFPDSGHTTAYAFLQYYDTYGGEPLFGLPITEPFYSGGRLVQYFERVRMEWWPERAPGERVALTDLGAIYAVPPHVSEAALRPVHDSADFGPTPTPAVTRLGLAVAVKYPVTRQSGSQTVYVLVTDQVGAPVQGADVQIVVYSGMGNHGYAVMTDQQGIASQTFQIEPDHPGKPVVVDVTVTFGGLSSTVETNYMQWWGP